jgi:ubiquinone/menaquinone biosynthesis C-methylase UbiE
MPRSRRLRTALLGSTLAVAVVVARRANLLGQAYALLYDQLNGRAERAFLGNIRDGLLSNAAGRVLEIGAGTGINLEHYPKDGNLEILVSEPDPAMLTRARRRAVLLGREVEFRQAGAYPLPFPDQIFDTIVFTLCLCTIDDPEAALKEARRVLKPEGKVLVLEHVRSARPELALWQDRLEKPWGVIAGGCHPNRDTKDMIERAGFAFEWLAEQEEERIPIPIVRPGILGVARLTA